MCCIFFVSFWLIFSLNIYLFWPREEIYDYLFILISVLLLAFTKFGFCKIWYVLTFFFIYLSCGRKVICLFWFLFVCLVVCLHFGGTCIRICNDFFAVWNTEKRVKNTLRSLLGYALMLCFVYINIFSNHVFFFNLYHNFLESRCLSCHN